MKNTKKDQLCSCIRISTDEFNDVVRKIYGHQVKVITDCNGIAVPITKTFNCPSCHHCQAKKSRYCPYCGHPMRS